MSEGDAMKDQEQAVIPICPKCRAPLTEIRYPSDSMLNRDQWESQIAGDFFCTCHNNHRGNKPYAYFWKRELTAVLPVKDQEQARCQLCGIPLSSGEGCHVAASPEAPIEANLPTIPPAVFMCVES